jgi:flagellar basal body-associated protein FliL
MRSILLRLCLIGAFLAAAPAWAADDAKDAKDPKDSKKPEHKITQSESYLSIDPFYTTIVADNHAGGMLMIGIGLDVPDPALRGEVVRSMPVLRDAYLRNLMAFTASTVRTDAQPDVGVIADRLQGITDRALNKKGARVLLAQVALRVTR